MASPAVTAAPPSAPSAFSSEDAADRELRARFYALLSSLLSSPPTAEILTLVAALEADETPLGLALGQLATIAQATGPGAVREEFDALFIGITRGEIVPYASYYLTGFLHEKPLAHIRRDLIALGIERIPGRCEPEDHLGFLLETMHGLALGTFPDTPAEAEKTFFQTHILSWADACLADIETASSARFYKPLATVGRLFLAIEREAFGMSPETPRRSFAQN